MQLADTISSYSQIVTLGGSLILVFFVFLSLTIKHLTPFLKKLLFFSMVSVIISVTFFLAGTTIYLNSISVSGGPVHHHADFEIWTCGKEINPEDPTGLSNKIGTSTVHEHNDKRIHIEGVVVKKEDESIGKFFESIGGKITNTSITLPTNEENIKFTSGDMCENGNTGFLQVFVYKVLNDTYYQEKIEDPMNYIISPHANVPPGDCIIVEFDSIKTKTQKICESFKVAEEVGKLKPSQTR